MEVLNPAEISRVFLFMSVNDVYLTGLPDMLFDSSVKPSCAPVSPNHDQRPGGCGDISLVVVHAISLPPNRFGGSSIEDLFTNRLDPAAHPYFAEIHQLRVSAHYLIRREGAVIEFVEPALRAWHAGVSSWRGRERCNDFSIGVELEGCDTLPFEPVQYEVLARLLVGFCARWPIRDVVGHSHVAPGRKTDPGPYFDWLRLRGELERAGGRTNVLSWLVDSGEEGAVADPMRWPFPLKGRPV